MARAKRSAHAELDELRQQAATERVKARDLDAQLDAAKLGAERAAAAVTEAMRLRTTSWWGSGARIEAAEAEVLDLQHRVSASPLRVERAQAEADSFQREHARDLLDEREPEAHEVAENLTRAGVELIRAHRAYGTLRAEIDGLVASVEGATSRADGPVPEHPWEREVRARERVVRDAAVVPAPSERWTGLTNRQQENEANLAERDRRSGEATEVAVATSGQWITIQ